MAFSCPDCNKPTNTQHGLDMHRWDKHGGIPCTFLGCPKRCKDLRALNQHTIDKHDGEIDHELWRPSPPVPSPGGWVETDDFPDDTQSFGYFDCADCDNIWTSAYAYSNYWQSCQGCENRFYPEFMWQNYGRRRGGKARDGAPSHDKGRCEACRAGLCLNVNYGY